MCAGRRVREFPESDCWATPVMMCWFVGYQPQVRQAGYSWKHGSKKPVCACRDQAGGWSLTINVNPSGARIHSDWRVTPPTCGAKDFAEFVMGIPDAPKEISTGARCIMIAKAAWESCV